MKENVRFYKCPICGNIIGLIDGNMEHVRCCGTNGCKYYRCSC